MDTRKGETTRLRRLLCQATSICGLCLAFSILAVILLLTVLFSALGIPAGTPPISVGGSIAFIFANGVVPVLTVIGEMLKSLSPWGVITIIVICVLLWGPDWIRSTISSSKWELPGGFKFDGSQASVSFQKELGEAERIVQRANRELEEAYSAAHTFASQLRTHYDIPSLASLAAVKVASLIGNRCPPDFRLTIYIPDLVFSDRLYQFTQYYDREGRPISNGVVGRTFSIRYGIIGRVWRSGVAEIEGELISKSEAVQMSESPTDAEMERILDSARAAGAREAGYVVLRLPLEVSPIFKDWLLRHYPDRYRHVLSLIRSMRDGKDYDSEWGKRMKGAGPYAWQIGRRFELAARRLGLNLERRSLRTDQFVAAPRENEQLTLL